MAARSGYLNTANGRRQLHHAKTGKYVRQAIRTFENKKRRILRSNGLDFFHTWMVNKIKAGESR